MRTKTAILAIALWPLSSAAGNSSTECMAGLRTALVEGHFTGPLVCNRRDATFVLVGRTARNRLSIYDYRYSYDPPGGSNVMHGGQKIVVFRGRTYLGQYAMSPPPYANVYVRGTQVVVQSEGQWARLDFSRKPPREVYVGWESHSFFK